MELNVTELSKIFVALIYAAQKHSRQKRKNKEGTPYINHLIDVTYLLVEVGKETDTDIILAAILHDTIEDTSATYNELAGKFGISVANYVMEVTDDKSLPEEERKQKQVDDAPNLSPKVKILKLCDKISNITDVIHNPPVFWSLKRKMRYLDWSEKVVNQLRGSNVDLEKLFDQRISEGRRLLGN